MNKIKVLIRGPALSASGYGEHCRFLMRSLKKDPRLELYLDNINWGSLGYEPKHSEERKEIYDLSNKTRQLLASGQSKFDATVQVTIPNEFKRYAEINIGVTAGIEVDRISPKWIELCQQMDKIITISEHSKNGLSKTVAEVLDKQTGQQSDVRITKPISVVPYPVTIREPKEMDLNLSTSFNFLLMALIGERKNIPNTIKWFVEEFHDDEDIGLVVKTALRNGSTIDRMFTSDTISQILSSFPNRKCKIYLLHGRLTEEEKSYLYTHESIKAMVSLSHGEGFGLPLFEAAAHALPVVAPNWSGQVDFLNHDVLDKKGKTKNKSLFTKVDYILAPVQESSEWKEVIEKGSRWCYPKENSYKMKIREVYKNYGMKKSIAKKLQNIILEKYETEKIHTLFLNEVMEKIEHLNVEDEEQEKEIDEMFKSLITV